MTNAIPKIAYRKISVTLQLFHCYNGFILPTFLGSMKQYIVIKNNN